MTPARQVQILSAITQKGVLTPASKVAIEVSVITGVVTVTVTQPPKSKGGKSSEARYEFYFNESTGKYLCAMDPSGVGRKVENTQARRYSEEVQKALSGWGGLYVSNAG